MVAVRTFGQATASNTTTTVSVDKPAGLSNGDVLYIVAYRDTATQPTSGPSGGTGSFTLIDSLTDSTNAQWMGVYRKVITNAAGEPSTYTVSWGSASSVTAIAFAVQDADTTTPEDGVTPVHRGNASGSGTASGVTTSATGRLIVGITGVHDNLPVVSSGHSCATAGSMTTNGHQESSGGSDCGIGVGVLEWSGSGDTGAYANSVVADPNIAILFVVKPVPVNNYTETPADVMGLGDGTPTVLLTKNELPSDAMALTDTPSRVWAAARDAVDPLALSDTSARVWEAYRDTTDPMGLTDSFTAEKVTDLVFTDTLGVMDTDVEDRGSEVTVADTLGLTDTALPLIPEVWRYTADVRVG